MSDPSAFRFGVVAGRPASGAAWLGTARRVERLGYDSLLLPDTASTPSPFVALAAAAAVTTRVRLGTWVLAAPLRTPGALQREAAALQLVSDGRLEAGLGTGRPGAAVDAQRVGAAWGTPRERLEQLLRAVDAVRQVEPVPPVTVAAAGPKALAAGGRWADTVALALSPTATVAEVSAAADTVRRAGAAALALQLSGVAGRWVAHLAHRQPPPEVREATAAFLEGGPAAMAQQLRDLSAATGVTVFPVAEEHAEAFAPVIPLLR